MHDEGGRLLADFSDTEGVDGGLTFAAAGGSAVCGESE